MITNFKIFENIDEQTDNFCYIVIPIDKFKNFYNKIKRLKLPRAFYIIDNYNIVCISSMTPKFYEDKFKYNYKNWIFDKVTALHFINYKEQISEEDLEIKLTAKKYNL